jgi:SOS-response transcriptional repressor LexA
VTLKRETERVFEYVRQYIRSRKGTAPSVREIARACFMSPSQVVMHLEVLEAHGKIARTPGRARALWLIESKDDRNRNPN